MGSVGFYFDENVAPPMAEVYRAVDIRAVSYENVGAKGWLDTQVIAYCCSERLTLVTFDKRIRFDKREKAALLSSGISVVEFRGKGLPLRVQLKTFVKFIDQIEKVLRDDTPCLHVLGPRSFDCRGKLSDLIRDGGAGTRQ